MLATSRKVPVSYGRNFTSEYLNAVNRNNLFVPRIGTESYDDPENPKRSTGSPQFLRGLKPVIFLGRCLGVISRGDVLDSKQSRRKIPFQKILTVCLTIFLLVNAVLMLRLNILQFRKDKTILVKIEGFNISGYTCTMFFVYAYQLFATTRIRDLVKSFVKADKESHLNNHGNSRNEWFSHFPRDCVLMLVLNMLLGVTENIIYDLHKFAGFTGNGMAYWEMQATSNLKKYYIQNFYHWHQVMPTHNSIVTLIFVLLVKVGTWGWFYMEILPIVLFRALWEKLKILEKSLIADLSTIGMLKRLGDFPEIFLTGKHVRHGKIDAARLHSTSLDDYQKEYLIISGLVNQVQAYVSPIIMAYYMRNIYVIIIMLFHWIGPFANNVKTNEEGLLVCFSLVYYCYRVGLVTYFVAEVHQMSMSLKEHVQTCPNDLYSVAVERLEKTLVCNPTGIHLFNTFIVTRHFFISILAFVFTTEIILLQAYAGHSPSQ